MNTLIPQKRYSDNHKQFVLDKTFIPVEIADRDDGRFLVDRDNSRVISRVSDRYELVRNEDLVKPLVQEFGIGNVSMIKRIGAYQFFYKVNTGRQFDIAGNGDIVDEQIVITNSYNKTRSFNFMFGAFRLICTNGLYTGQCTFNYRKIHVGDIPVAELVQNVLDNYTKNDFKLWRALAAKPLQLEEQKELIHNFNAFEVDPKKAKAPTYIDMDGIERETAIYMMDGNQKLNKLIQRQALMEVERPEGLNNQRNAWGLFNAFNYSINRLCKQSDLGKKILGNKTAENYLMQNLNLDLAIAA